MGWTQIPLKIDGALQDKRVYSMLYTMHLDSPILKEMEERVEKILDSDYSGVDIDEMVDGLDIHWDSKRELKKILKKNSNTFWWRFKSEEKLLFAGGSRIFGISTHQGRVETPAKEVSCD